MLDSLTVPRRAFDFEDYVDILRRNLRWILGPAFAGLVIATVVAYVLPDTYVSTALIRVTPQQISPELIQNVTTQDVADRISGMAQTILSRATLTSMINAYGLYKSDLKSEPMQDVVEKMHKAIMIMPLGANAMNSRPLLPAVEVGFSYSDRFIAQKVCADLVSRFMNLSSQDVAQSQEEAGQFLDDETQDAKRDLDKAEQKLSDYEGQHAGRLPDEMSMNMQAMNALNGQLSALTESANRNNEQRMMLENELQIQKGRLTGLHSPQAVLQNQKLAGLDTQIQQQETAISGMRERYTEDYPGLQSAKDQLAFLKRQRDAAAKEKPPKVDTAGMDNPALAHDRLEAQESMDRIQTELKANAIEAAQISRDQGRVNGALRNYQGRLEGAPADEKEWSDLVRDRDIARARYLELDQKRERSNVSIDMERRKQGETLELLDAASLPATPTKPKRPIILPIGTGIGFALGIVIVGIREVKDTSLKNLKDARLYTQLSILGSIPLLENDIVVQRRKQVMWVGWATATIAGLAIMASSVVHYYWTKG